MKISRSTFCHPSFVGLRATLILACVGFALAGSEALAAERTYDFQKKVLGNGLTVLSLEDHTCPIVAVQVWYHVGSKDEDAKRQGFAHMFEHMMFRGTDVLGPEQHFESIRRTGGDCNAYTSFDNTTYVNELPSNQLELALWLEAERMAFLKIDEESFHKERAVVEEERRMGSLNTPYGTVPEKLLPVIFTKHPYQWTPIGQIPHLRAATIDELQQFWDRYYVPSNATLVVVGDTTHADVQRLAEKYFDWLPKMPPPKRTIEKEPPQTAARNVTIPEKKGPAPIIGIVYRGVPQGHDDALLLEMLMDIVGSGESSRIHKDLVKERKIAQFAGTGAFALEDDGIAAAGAAIMPWGDKQKVMDALREHINKARTEPVTQRELEKAKNKFLFREVTNSLTVERKASLLGQYEVLEGGADKANERLAKIRGVTADDLLRVGKTYLSPERETSAIVQPELGGLIKSWLGGKNSEVDEGAAAVPAPIDNRVAKRGGLRADLSRPDSFPKSPPSAKLLEAMPQYTADETTLSNGLRVVVVPNHEVPDVTALLGLVNGGWTEKKPGTANLAAEMITKGSANHTAAELAEELEFNAISLSGDSSIDVASVFAECVTDKFDTALKLMAEVVRTPTFPDGELEVLRQQELLGLMVQAKTPEYAADREMRRRLYGSHPYARTAVGEPSDVQGLKVDDLKSWWATHVRPDSAVLYIAGDVEPAVAKKLAEKYFGEWKVDGEKPSVALPELPEKSATRIYLVDRPGSVQSQIRVGQRGITRKDPDYFPTVVLSQIFGGSFGSRLNKAIRVEKGLTYGARGGWRANRFAGSLSISTFTKNPTTAETLKMILSEVDRLEDSKPESSELDIARSYILGSFAGNRETPGQIVGDLWLIRYADLPKDYLMQYLNGVRNTTEEALQRVANRLIDKDKLTIVVVGEAEAIKADLEKIAPVTIVNEQSDGTKDPSASEPKQPS